VLIAQIVGSRPADDARPAATWASYAFQLILAWQGEAPAERS
jgi:hypothetical protein